MSRSSRLSSWFARGHRAACVLGLALALSACVSGPNFVQPAASAPARYTNSPLEALGSSVQRAGAPSAQDADAPWWAPLQSVRLDELIREALERNHDLAAARATLAQARELAAASEAPLYPQVDLTASAGRERYGAAFLGPEHFPPFTFYAVGASVSYTFDFAGGVRRSIEQQRANVSSQQHEVQAAALSLSGSVALQALTVASVRAQIQSVEALLTDDQTDLRLVQDAFEAGSANRVDVLTAQSQRANDETLLPPLRRELSTGQHALALLVGRAPGEWSAPDFTLEEFVLPSHLYLTLPSELAHCLLYTSRCV